MIVCRPVFRWKEEQEVSQQAPQICLWIWRQYYLSGEGMIGQRESHVGVCCALLDVVLQGLAAA